MIKLRGPEGCTSCNCAGTTYESDKRGVFIVPLEVSGDLIKFHKFQTIVEAVEEPRSKRLKLKTDELETSKDNELDELDKSDELDENKSDKKDELDELDVPVKLDNKKNK